MDKIDQTIINYLKSDARLTHKRIGELIHMSGQAVGARVNKLIDNGDIQNYTIQVKHAQQQFIRIFMDNNNYSAFEIAVNTYPEIDHFYKISGQACYMIVSHFSTDDLNLFISNISNWGRYTIETVIADKKVLDNELYLQDR